MHGGSFPSLGSWKVPGEWTLCSLECSGKASLFNSYWHLRGLHAAYRHRQICCFSARHQPRGFSLWLSKEQWEMYVLPPLPTAPPPMHTHLLGAKQKWYETNPQWSESMPTDLLSVIETFPPLPFNSGPFPLQMFLHPLWATPIQPAPPNGVWNTKALSPLWGAEFKDDSSDL